MLIESLKWSRTPDPAIAKGRSAAGNAYWWWMAHEGIDPEWLQTVAGPFTDFRPEHLKNTTAEKIAVFNKAYSTFASGLPPTANKYHLFKWLDAHLKGDPHDLLNVSQANTFFSQILQLPRLLYSLGTARGTVSSEGMEEVAEHNRHDFFRYLHNYLVWKSGAQVFRISPALSEKLLLTDPKDLNWDDVRLPFPAFVLEFPEPLFSVMNPDTGRHWVDTLMVCQTLNTPHAEDAISAREKSVELMRKDPFCTLQDHINLGFNYGPGISISSWAKENENSRGFLDDDFSFTNIGSPRSGKLDTALDMLCTDATCCHNAEAIRLHSETGKDVYRTFLQHVFNIILYINSRPEDVQKEPPDPKIKEIHNQLGKKNSKVKRGKLLNELAKLSSKPKAFVVGTRVLIDKALSAIARRTGSGHTPSIASYVRGHIRNQAHGPQHSLRKLKWIEPFWRNLQAEAVSQKTYTVKPKHDLQD